jgi:integrase
MSAGMTVRELTARYARVRELAPQTMALYEMMWTRFERFLGRPATVADLNVEVVSQYIEWRKVTPGWRGRLPKPATVRRDRNMIRATWEYAARRKLLDEFPELPRVRVPESIPTGRAWTLEEASTLIRAARRRIGQVGGLPARWWWPTLLYAAVCTAERFEALTSIRWAQVDLERRTMLFLAGSRKGTTRDIVRSITPQLATMLGEHRRGDEDLVWPWDRRGRSQWASLQVLCRTAGVEYRGRGFHGFRRLAASLAAAKFGRAAATELLDHYDPRLQRVYVDPVICPPTFDSLAALPELDIDDPGPSGGVSGG